MQQTMNFKTTAHTIIDSLSNEASWDDLIYQIVERREVELGLADSDAGKTTPVEDVMQEFGIKP